MADLRKFQELNLNSRLLAALKPKRPAKEIFPIIIALEPLTDHAGELETPGNDAAAKRLFGYKTRKPYLRPTGRPK
jgi:hypothetical protein